MQWRTGQPHSEDGTKTLLAVKEGRTAGRYPETQEVPAAALAVVRTPPLAAREACGPASSLGSGAFPRKLVDRRRTLGARRAFKK